MTELKTFKDFMYDEWYYKDGTQRLSRSTRLWHVSANNNLKRIRKEAIKWVKEKFTWKYTVDDQDDVFDMHLIDAQKSAFMDFFNITEDELK